MKLATMSWRVCRLDLTCLKLVCPASRRTCRPALSFRSMPARSINVVLQVGQASEQVEVEANAALVETRTTAIGQVVTNQQVAEMPLNGRDPHELIFLAGMANYPGQGSMNSIRNYPTVVVSVAGGNGDGVSYLLDGSIWQDPYNSLSLPLPFPDALQEFKVETSAMPAQYGFHATATVNAVTKSGTNEFHGDLFEFVRNGNLNARDFFALKARHVEAQSVRRNRSAVRSRRTSCSSSAAIREHRCAPTASRTPPLSPHLPRLRATSPRWLRRLATTASRKRCRRLSGSSTTRSHPGALNPVAVNIAKTFPGTQRSLRPNALWTGCQPGRGSDRIEDRLPEQLEAFHFRTLHVGTTESGVNVRRKQPAFDQQLWVPGFRLWIQPRTTPI